MSARMPIQAMKDMGAGMGMGFSIMTTRSMGTSSMRDIATTGMAIPTTGHIITGTTMRSP